MLNVPFMQQEIQFNTSLQVTEFYDKIIKINQNACATQKVQVAKSSDEASKQMFSLRNKKTYLRIIIKVKTKAIVRN